MRLLGKHLWRSLMMVGFFSLILTGCSTIKSGVLNPQGPVAQKQYDLIILSVVLMLIIFVVVAALFVYMLVKYRATPENEGYEPPDQVGSTKLEIIWTAIPVIIVLALAVPTVTSTFDLEKSPSPNTKPMTIEVVSADWKWIFKYPEQGIMTVNHVEIPANVPIRFELNAVGPMNSFWVPELGGQEYTMPGMAMKLWLEADKPGKYLGRSANFSGEGFTHMQFTVNSMKKTDFDKWVQEVKNKAPQETLQGYQQLLKPGLVSEQTYSSYPNYVPEEHVGEYNHGHMDKHSSKNNQNIIEMQNMTHMH